MKIAVLGTGHVGATLAERWKAAGHDIVLGSRDPASTKSQRLAKELAPVRSIAQAASEGEAILLAVPWAAAQAALDSAGNLRDKLLIDAVNPINDDFTGLDLGFTTSAAEVIASWAINARVVKAFNTVGAKIMADPGFSFEKASMFYCGDDPAAKKLVHQLAVDVGLQPYDAGPLSVARYLEPFAMLYIHLAFHEGWGGNFAFKVLKR